MSCFLAGKNYSDGWSIGNPDKKARYTNAKVQTTTANSDHRIRNVNLTEIKTLTAAS